jgi:hypothetical protein
LASRSAAALSVSACVPAAARWLSRSVAIAVISASAPAMLACIAGPWWASKIAVVSASRALALNSATPGAGMASAMARGVSGRVMVTGSSIARNATCSGPGPSITACVAVSRWPVAVSVAASACAVARAGSWSPSSGTVGAAPGEVSTVGSVVCAPPMARATVPASRSAPPGARQLSSAALPV